MRTHAVGDRVVGMIDAAAAEFAAADAKAVVAAPSTVSLADAAAVQLATLHRRSEAGDLRGKVVVRAG